jgi:hypothetical protein
MVLVTTYRDQNPWPKSVTEPGTNPVGAYFLLAAVLRDTYYLNTNVYLLLLLRRAG